MSMGLHRDWYKGVILQSKQIEDLLKRLEFLRNKRNTFRSENFGSIDSDIVVNALDNEIRDLQSDIILLHSIKPSSPSELKGGNSLKPETIIQEEIAEPVNSDRKFTMTEAALILVYTGVKLRNPRSDSSKQADKIAKGFGFISGTSGEKLHRIWEELSLKNGITGDTGKEREKLGFKKMIKRIEKILPELKEPSQRARAEADIRTLDIKIN